MYGENQDEVFLGYSLGRQQNISEATAETIDQEVRRLVHEAHDTATRILTERSADLDTLAKGLTEFETLTGDEIVGLLQGVRPVRNRPPTASRRRRRARRCPRRASHGRWTRSPAASSLSPRSDGRYPDGKCERAADRRAAGGRPASSRLGRRTGAGRAAERPRRRPKPAVAQGVSSRAALSRRGRWPTAR